MRTVHEIQPRLTRPAAIDYCFPTGSGTRLGVAGSRGT